MNFYEGFFVSIISIVIYIILKYFWDKEELKKELGK